MAFTPETISVIVQPVGGEGMRFINYRTDDAQADVLVTDYFANVGRRGVRVNDLIFVSPVTADYDAYILVVIAVDADGNATAGLSEQGPIASVASMVANPALRVGDIVDTVSYHDGTYKGGNRYVIVAAATGTADGGSYIDLDNGLQAQGVFPNDIINATQFGAVGDGSTDNLTELGLALAVGENVYLPPNRFVSSGDITIDANGQRLFGANAAEVFNNSEIYFSDASGDAGTTGINVTGSGIVLERISVQGVSRTSGVKKLINAEYPTDTQPDIDLFLRECLIGGAPTLVYINGRGLFMQGCSITGADVCVDIDFPTDFGTATNYGNTLRGGARKYLISGNYVHQASGAFVRNTGTNAQYVHDLQITNNKFDNGTSGLWVFEGHLNNGLISGNTTVRQGNSLTVVTGSKGVSRVHNNLMSGAVDDISEGGFDPVFCRSLGRITGACETLEYTDNTVVMSNRPVFDIDADVDVLVIDGLTCRDILMGNGDGRTDSVIEIASGVTVGRLVVKNVHLNIPAMAGNASAYILKNSGTIGELIWEDVTVNSDAGLAAEMFGCAGRGQAVTLAKTANQTLTTATNTALTWATLVRDESPMVNLGTSNTNVVAPHGTKRVLVSGSVEFAANSTGDRRVRVTKDSLTYPGMATQWVATSATSSTIVTIPPTIVDWDEGDVLKLDARQTSGGNLDVVASDYTWFSVVPL